MHITDFLFIPLLVVGIWYVWQRRRLIRNIESALQRKRPLLQEHSQRSFWTGDLDRLAQSVNTLIGDHLKVERTGEGYLEQISKTLGNLREAVIIIDSANTIRLANPAFRKWIRTEGDPVGRRLDAFLQGSAFQAFLHTVHAGDVGERQELEVVVNKAIVWFEIAVAPLNEEAEASPNKPPLQLMVLHDITRQKHLEKVRTDFVANVSHELKTPVTIIKGFADTLLEDDSELSPEERRHFLNKIRSNSERLHLLLQELLLLSRLEAPGGSLQRERISLGKLVAETCDNWRARLDAETQSLSCAIADGNDTVYADPLRLSQVLTNLLDNVLRHAKNFKAIKVSTVIESIGVAVVVEDDGNGIPEKDLPHIFQRFYRVEKGRSREAGGTGLGLAIVKHIIQQHGGSIDAESRVGEGTRVHFLIPFPERMAEQAVFKALRRQSAEVQG